MQPDTVRGAPEDRPIEPRPPLDAWRFVLLVALAGGAVSAALVPFDGAGLGLLALLFTLAFAGALALVVDRARGGVFRASGVYLTMFGLFHGGLLVAVAVRGQGAFLATTQGSNDWLFGPWAPQAVRMVIVGLLSFSVAAAVAPSLGAGRRVSETPDRAEARRAVIRLVGPAMFATGFLLFLNALLTGSGGLGSTFASGYTAFVEQAQSSPGYAYSPVLVGLGSALSVVAGGRARRVGWTGFATYAVLAFPLGLRGEVLFPLVAMLVLEARQGRRLTRSATIVGASVVLLLIAIVRQTRLSGIGALFSSSALASPLDAIAEMGYSLRPSAVVVEWHAAGEEFLHGWTVAGSPVRLITGLLGLPDVVPPGARLFTVEIAQREGSLGGSPIAEGFHNFGMVGVAGLMIAFGLLLGRLESRPVTVSDDVVLVAVFVPLLVEIRNGLAPMVLQLLIGLFVVALVRPAGFRAATWFRPGVRPR